MTLAALLPRLEGVKRAPAGWTARCPAHDDKEPSLSVSAGADGRILLHCHANCAPEAVLSALGLKWTDVFAESPSTSSSRTIVATYDYTDEAGKLLFQCVRYAPKDFKQRRPDPQKPGAWLWNLKGTRRALYRLPELKAALAEGRTVFVPEGEKDCDALVRHGFTATCNPMGAGKWLPEHTSTLQGAARVVVVCDKDEVGRTHALFVAKSLHGVARKVKLLELPDVNGRSVKDSADFFNAGGTTDELKAIVNAALEFVPATKLVPGVEPKRCKPRSSASEILEACPSLAPAPYTPPPLDLLCSPLQDYVLAAAESLSVDVSYIFLPMLSALATAIGNSRIVQLKPGFTQPPVIWTGIIGRSGSKKSPALAGAIFAIREREREMVRENREAQEVCAEGDKPIGETVLLDDLTLAALGVTLAENPRGLMVAKDELSHWFASFDQYHQGHGSDVARWLSLHTGVLFALDRKLNRERFRLFNPRVNITGGIQPKILKQCLTEEFFDRGLPARFLFAYPPARQDRWNEAVVPNLVHADAWYAFAQLFLLEPDGSTGGDFCPKVLTLSSEAKEVFIPFYNSAGAQAVDSGDQHEALWSKLTGTAARLSLIGELAGGPDAETISGAVMKAATELTLWFGKESARIYSLLAEGEEARELRRLAEFIERRGGTVTVRDVISNYWPLKNQSDQAEYQLNRLVTAGMGEWLPMTSTPKGGKPTRPFRLFAQSSPHPHLQYPKIPENFEGIADADDISSVQNGPEAVPEGLEEHFI
jgi:hypothetical protein